MINIFYIIPIDLLGNTKVKHIFTYETFLTTF